MDIMLVIGLCVGHNIALALGNTPQLYSELVNNHRHNQSNAQACELVVTTAKSSG
jgi:hypothetical protein